jgi:dTDP-4-dehydrorhamnose 3,5-epimerase-like enzyme
VGNFIGSTSEPTVIVGGRAVDDRGALGFINGFELSEFKRFYTVENHEKGFIRAWHGHLLEAKAILVLRGSALVCAVKMTDTTRPSKEEVVKRVILSASNTSAFFVPAGYANGFKTLSDDALILVFSSKSLVESLSDDFRFPFDYWNPWEIVPR